MSNQQILWENDLSFLLRNYSTNIIYKCLEKNSLTRCPYPSFDKFIKLSRILFAESHYYLCVHFLFDI